jgi:hypothetical protein
MTTTSYRGLLLGNSNLDAPRRPGALRSTSTRPCPVALSGDGCLLRTRVVIILADLEFDRYTKPTESDHAGLGLPEDKYRRY